VPGQNGG